MSIVLCTLTPKAICPQSLASCGGSDQPSEWPQLSQLALTLWIVFAARMTSKLKSSDLEMLRVLKVLCFRLNYVVGSCAAAGVCGAWQKSAVLGFSMCIFFCKNFDRLKFTEFLPTFFIAIAGCAKKLSLEEGWTFFPPLKQHGHTGCNTRSNDYTLTAEGERGWTRG